MWAMSSTDFRQNAGSETRRQRDSMTLSWVSFTAMGKVWNFSGWYWRPGQQREEEETKPSWISDDSSCCGLCESAQWSSSIQYNSTGAELISFCANWKFNHHIYLRSKWCDVSIEMCENGVMVMSPACLPCARLSRVCRALTRAR